MLCFFQEVKIWVLYPGHKDHFSLALWERKAMYPDITKLTIHVYASRLVLKNATHLISVEKHRDLLTLADLLATRQVTPLIDRTYPLDEAADALRYVGAGHTRGKVVITL